MMSFTTGDVNTISIPEPIIQIDMDQFNQVVLELRDDGIYLVVRDGTYLIKSGTIIIPKTKKGEQKKPPINGIGEKK